MHYDTQARREVKEIQIARTPGVDRGFSRREMRYRLHSRRLVSFGPRSQPLDQHHDPPDDRGNRDDCSGHSVSCARTPQHAAPLAVWVPVVGVSAGSAVRDGTVCSRVRNGSHLSA